jgi:hypothetical protein
MNMGFVRATVAVALVASAASASAERLFGLTTDNRIVSFNSNNAEAVISSRAITGVQAGDTLLGIDVRPATLSFWSVAQSGNVYELLPMGGKYVATLKSTLSVMPSGSSFGIDFNPVPDRLRMVSNTGQNLRINVDTGVTILDGTVSSTTGAVNLIGAAYTNSFAGTTSTMLYAIDTVGDTLLRSTNPNAGTYTNLNLMGEAFQPLGLSFTNANMVGFDISANDSMAYLTIDSLLWRVDLGTGRATSLGLVGAGPLRGLTARGFMAAVPEPASWAMMIAGFGMVGAIARRRRMVPATA